MPNTVSAAKALRQAKRHRVRNVKKKRSLKDVMKQFERALTAKNKSEAAGLLPKVQKALDKSSKSHIITKNTASRKKSRLALRLAKLA
jgi:small subunit ribosomal protein S20